MKRTFRKSLSMLLALTMIVAVMLSATACGGGGGESGGIDPEAGRGDFIESLGGVSETFAGAVSEEGYDTAEDAATAYVAEEIAGESEANVVSAVSKGTVDASSINIPEEFSEGIVSVEKYEVEYSLSDGPSLMSTNLNSSNKKVDVYIIKYETEWKYFSPAPITGETISKSYYDSVFNNNKYQNCTFEYKMDMNMDMTASAEGYTQSVEMAMTMYQLVKYEEGKLYLKQTMTSSSNMGEAMPTKNESIEAYVETVGDDLVCYVNTGNGWQEGNLYQIGFMSLEELTPFHDQYIDYTYFTKTDFGFKIADENAKKFVDEFYSQLLMGMAEAFDLDMYAEYYVCDGTLSGIRMDMLMDIDYTQMGATVTGDATIKGTTTCTNYGTTVVEKPAGIN